MTRGFVWNSAENTIFRVGFGVLFLSICFWNSIMKNNIRQLWVSFEIPPKEARLHNLGEKLSFRLNLKCNFSAWRSVFRFSSISVSVNINFYSRLIWSSYGTSTEMPNYFLPSLIQPNIWYISKKNDFIRSNVKTLQFQALGCSLFSLFLHLLVARDEMIDQRHMIHNLWIIIMSHDRNIIYDCTNIRIPWQCNKLIFEITFFSRIF